MGTALGRYHDADRFRPAAKIIPTDYPAPDYSGHVGGIAPKCGKIYGHRG